jgi:hypothetical protein
MAFAGGDGIEVSREETVASEPRFLIFVRKAEVVVETDDVRGMWRLRLGLGVGAEERLPRPFAVDVVGTGSPNDDVPADKSNLAGVGVVGVSVMLIEGLRTGFDLPIRFAGAIGSGSMNGRPDIVVPVACLVARRAARGGVGGVARAVAVFFETELALALAFALVFAFDAAVAVLRFFFWWGREWILDNKILVVVV